MDKFNTIKTFVTVVESGSFAGASRLLGVSRSAVNKLVFNLENHLGVQLFNRTTRKVIPTETGITFYHRCVNILQELESAELAISELQQHPQGSLRINAPMSFGTINLGNAIADFTAQYPQLKVELTLEDRFVDPIAEGYDAVIRIAENVDSSTLVSHQLKNIELVLCASEKYLTQHPTPEKPEDLTQHCCLHYGYLNSTAYWHFQQTQREYIIKIDGRFYSNNGEILAQGAMQGLGITLLPKFIVEDYLNKQQLVRVLPDYSCTNLNLWLIYPLNRHLSSKIKSLTQFLQNLYK